MKKKKKNRLTAKAKKALKKRIVRKLLSLAGKAALAGGIFLYATIMGREALQDNK